MADGSSLLKQKRRPRTKRDALCLPTCWVCRKPADDYDEREVAPGVWQIDMRCHGELQQRLVDAREWIGVFELVRARWGLCFDAGRDHKLDWKGGPKSSFRRILGHRARKQK